MEEVGGGSVRRGYLVDMLVGYEGVDKGWMDGRRVNNVC